MNLPSILSIAIGAAFGALFRLWLGLKLNTVFLMIPLGTLLANVIGGFLIGIFMALTKHHPYIPEAARFAITTGFLGGLTTFSAFSAETVTLITHQEYFWSFAIIVLHVAGSVLATFFGIYTIKFFTS